MCLNTIPNLKILFAKWTRACAVTAIAKGKNKENTGNNKVPNPNPEKKVKIAPINTVIATTT